MHYLSKAISTLFVVLTITLFVSNASAQVITITDVQTLAPIERVSVFNLKRNFSAISNSDGKVTLNESLKQGDTLTFRHTSHYEEKFTIAQLKEREYKVDMIFKVIRLKDYVITISKQKENINNIPNKVKVIYARELQFMDPQTSADMLQNTGEVFIQKSQMGGGSPVIRGFEANKVLLVVDGVRMNNAIYRAGHLQNVITINPSMLDRTEVIFGPGSLIYGSDALGGVMHFITRKPAFGIKGDPNIKSNALVRTATANNEGTFQVDFNIGFKNFASLTSISYSSFGDLRIGKVRRNNLYRNWGRRLEYVRTENNTDSIIESKDPDRLRFTGFNQADVMQKFRINLSKKIEVSLNTQYSTSSNIPRFDRLNDYNGDELKYAEWYYGPQNRFLTALHIDFKSFGFFDRGDITLAYQMIDEDRIDRKFQDPLRRIREEDVQVMTANIDLQKTFNKKQKIHYGMEAVLNEVQSSASTFNILTETIGATSTRYPDGDNSMNSYSAYLTHKWEIGKDVFLSDGIRFSQIMLNSTFIDTTYFNFPYSSIELNTSSITGSLGISWKTFENLRTKIVGATGFRAPNIDDVAKVFDSNPGNVIVPNPDLKPEYVYNGEISIIPNYGSEFRLNATFFFTYMTNAIVRSEYTFNGQDSITYDGVLSNVQANVNIGEAFIRGFNVNMMSEMSKQWSLRASFNYTKGENLLTGGPLGHIPPFFGETGITFQHKKLKVDFATRFNAWKRVKDYSPSEDKLEEATLEGTPSWFVINTRASYQFNKSIRVNIGLENMLDHHYKPFASGISGPGRNLIVAIRGRF